MKNFIHFVWDKHRSLGLALVATLIALMLLLGDFARDAIYFNDPANKNRELELWMSPRYVDLSWRLTRPVTLEIMQIDPDAAHKESPRTLREVLAHTGMTLDELQAKVEQAQRDLQGQREK